SIAPKKASCKIYEAEAGEDGNEAGPQRPRLPAEGACLRQRREGGEEGPAVSLDAGRVHWPRASCMVETVGLFFAGASPQLRRVRGRTGGEHARPADIRKTDCRWAGHPRYA